MKAVRQIALSFAVLAAGLYVWIAYVPAARPLLDRFGLLDLLGLELPAETGGNGGGLGGGPVRVNTATVSEEATSDRITALGEGRALRSVSLRAEAAGTITGITVTSGSYVTTGAVVLRLQDEAEQIALERAQIQLENARTDAERARRLEATGAVAEVRLREFELALRSAELALRQAQFDLAQRQVVAPISGWVGILDLEVGDRVSAQDLLVTITDRTDILIDFRVPERVVGKIAIGQPLEVSPLGGRDMALPGQISAIDAVVDRASRTLLVQARVPNEADLLRAGMAFSVAMSFPGDRLLSVPPLAVQWSGDGPFVWAVREGKAARVAVSIAQRDSDAVLISSSGLGVGETVITEGVQTLRDGSNVSVRAEGEALSGLQGVTGQAAL